MSACRLALVVPVLLAIAFAAGNSNRPVMAFQSLQEFANDPRVQLIDGYVRSQHPTELLSAILNDVGSTKDNQNYRLFYTANGDNYLSVTKQADPSSGITEVYWGKVRKDRQGATAALATESGPLVGAFGAPSIPSNDPEFDLVDRFVRDLKKEELKDATVTSVRTQVVSGMNYKINYQTKDNRSYEAVVYRQSWTNTTKLSSFKQTTSTDAKVGAASPDAASANGSSAKFPLAGGYQSVTDRMSTTFAKADSFARSQYPVELADATIIDAQQQVVSGSNHKINYDSPTGRYEVIVYQQPWTNTIRVSNFFVLERKNLPLIPKAPDSQYKPLTDFQTDASFQKLDAYLRNRYPAMLANAVVYDVLRTPDAISYRVNYQVDNKMITINAAVTPQPSSRRRLLQSGDGYSDIPNYLADANFVSIDRMVKNDHANELLNSQVVRAEMRDNGGSFNYRITYQTASGSYEAIVYSEPSSRTKSIISWRSSGTPQIVTNNNVFGASSSIASSDGTWQPASLSDQVVQRVDQLIRAEKNQIGNGPLTKAERQNSSSYRMQYAIDGSTDLQVMATYNNKADSIFVVSSVRNSRTSFAVMGTAATAAAVAAATATNPSPLPAPPVASSDGFAPLLNYQADPDFMKVDAYARSKVPEIQYAQIVSVRVQKGSGLSYKIQYKTSSGNILELSIDSQSMMSDQAAQPAQPASTMTTTTTTTTTSSSGGASNPSLVQAIQEKTPTLNTGSSSTTTTTTETFIADGYTVYTNWGSDTNVARSDQQIQSQIPQLSGATIVGVWTKPIATGGTSYKIRYRTNSGAFTEIDVDQATPPSEATPSSTTSTSATTQVATQETALANFETNEGVQKVKQYVQENVPSLRGSNIVGVWTSYTPEGLTNYRTRFLTQDGQFVEVNLAYQQQKGIADTPTNSSQTTVNTTQTILATTPDGYQLLKNFGLDPTFLKIDQYARVQKPELAGAQVNAVWTMQIPNLGTSYRIRYTTSAKTVVEVTLVFKVDTGSFEFDPTIPTPPPINTVTTTVVGYQIFQTFASDPVFQEVDKFVKNQLPNIVNSQIIAVWIEAIPGTNNYRVQYLLPDGSIQEVKITYITTTKTSEIVSVQELNPPVKKNATTTNVVTTTNNSAFNPKWTQKNFTAGNNTITKNTTTITTQYYPGITLNPNFTNPNQTTVNSVVDTAGNTTLVTNTTVVVSNNTFNPNWRPPVPLPSFNTTTTNTTTINTTFIPNPPPSVPPPVITPPVTVINTTTITTDVNESNWQPPQPPKYPQVPVIPSTNTTIVTTNTTTNYQQVDNSSEEINFIDNWCRQQITRLVGARFINIWKLIGTNTYKVEYLTKDGVNLVVIVNRMDNGSLVLVSVNSNSNTNTINTTTVTNYEILNNYSTDVDFSRVDIYVRRMVKELAGARIVSVWIQFLDNKVVNYRINYLLVSGVTIEITCRRSSSTNVIEIISNKVISRNTSTNITVTTNTSTNVNTNFFSTFKTDYTMLLNWSTNSEFLLIDRYVRSQFAQLRNSQVVAVWIMVQVNVGANYKIQYLLNGRTVQIIVNKIQDSDRITVVSSTLTGGYQPFVNYRNDLEFRKADEFARTQMPQLRTATIVAVWIQISNGVSYRVQYNSNQNVMIEVVISYSVTSDSYTFELISPLTLIDYIVKPDPLCKTFKRNICIECSFRSVFDATRKCKPVNQLCNTYDMISGQCTSCYGGYSLNNKGACVTTVSLLPPNCADMFNGGCTSCNIGYILMLDGSCKSRMPGCQTMLRDGTCVSCSIGYLLNGGVCQRNF